MINYIVDPKGNIKEIDLPPTQLRRLFRQGYKRPTLEERINFLENKKKQLNKKIAQNKLLDVYFYSPQKTKDGYGVSAGNLEQELFKQGIFLNRQYTGQAVGLCYHLPTNLTAMPTEYKILYTMFESSKLPDFWGDYLHLADLVLVPSKFLVNLFKEQFNIDAIEVPLGIDTNIYKYYERRYKNVFTFLHYDAFKRRKGWDILLNAFQEEFKDVEDVRLILKSTRDKPLPISDPRIEVISAIYTPLELNNLLQRADCFVFPTRGEGFGLTPLEASATGIKSLVPNELGIATFFNSLFVELETDPINASYDNALYSGMDVGLQYNVKQDSIRAKMREAYNEYKNKTLFTNSKQISEYARGYSIEKTAKTLAPILKSKQKEGLLRIKNKNRENEVALIMENIAYYSGGRYHNWLQGVMLKNAGYDVNIYTNYMPIFAPDFYDYPQPKVSIVDDLETLDVKAGAYFGSPVQGSIRALELGAKYNKPVYITVFDPPQWIKESPVCDDSELQRHYTIKKAIHTYLKDIPEFKLIVLTENAIKEFSEWYELDEKYITYSHPAVNDRVISLFKQPKERKNWIVAVSRNSKRKKWGDVLSAFQPYAKDYELHLITHAGDGLKETAVNLGIPLEKIKIYQQISDLEKYKLFTRAKVLLSSSVFEGFGIWAIEGIASGCRVVMYDLPSLQWLKHEGVHRAKFDDVKDLSKKLGEVLDLEPIKPYTGHNTDKIASTNLTKIVKRPAKRKLECFALVMALNEGKYIQAVIKSLIKHEEIKKVIIVEGADKNYPRKTEDGKSLDDQHEKIIAIKSDKVDYTRLGIVENKEELRQFLVTRAYELGALNNWGLIMDGDEVFKDEEFLKLLNAMYTYDKVGVIYFKHLHFWKNYNTTTHGAQWDSRAFRLFRFAEPKMRITGHAQELVTTDGKKVGDKYGRHFADDIEVYHYGALKDAEDIYAKLDYYRNRDKHLKVVDTWTNWKRGEPTQWTSGGGYIKGFLGEHPEEIKKFLKK